MALQFTPDSTPEPVAAATPTAHAPRRPMLSSAAPGDTALTRRFKDPLYDYMSFGPRLCSIIDTKQFQRLRRVKQLGTSYYVWPTACHNRFEHCLGVAHLAQTMAKHLQESQSELGITDEEVDCVAIAGLCHDLGHGPWSHVWDGLFIPQAIPGSTWKHEDASEMMFDDLVQEYNINLSADEVLFIKALIAGNKDAPCDFQLKPYLFEIVANKRNGLDVDKYDYIARDSQAVGMANITGLTRLIDSARVIEHQICYNIKDVNQVYQVCYTRFSLHKMIYNHKTAKAIEYMIIDGLLAAEPYMKIAERICDPKRFLHLTDNIKDEIEASTAPELAPARAIFDRISSRDLYSIVDFNIIEYKDMALARSLFTPAHIIERLFTHTFTEEELEHINPEDVKELLPKDIIVDFATMHYGMKEENPLKFVAFYSKRDLNKCEKPDKGDISLLLPDKFGEVLLRVYTKIKANLWLTQKGYRLVVDEFNKARTEPAEPTVVPVVPLNLDDSEDEAEAVQPSSPSALPSSQTSQTSQTSQSSSTTQTSHASSSRTSIASLGHLRSPHLLFGSRGSGGTLGETNSNGKRGRAFGRTVSQPVFGTQPKNVTVEKNRFMTMELTAKPEGKEGRGSPVRAVKKLKKEHEGEGKGKE